MFHHGTMSNGEFSSKAVSHLHGGFDKKPMNVLKFMILTMLSIAPTWTIHAHDDKPPSLIAQQENKTERDKDEDEPLISAVHYGPFKHWKEQFDRYSAKRFRTKIRILTNKSN